MYNLKDRTVYIQNITNTLHKFRKQFLTMLAIFLLGISALLRANFYYIDDMGRALLGYKDFDFFSRYIPQYFTTVLHADNYLTDVSPLPQLVAVAILAITAVMVLYVVTERKEYTFVEYISTIPLCFSPYFLECLSYKYDAPYMALSILASVLPLVFHKRNDILYCLSVFISTLVVCMSYQAASGIFPMFVILIAFLKWTNNVDWSVLLRFILVSAVGYIAGMLFYAVFLMKTVDTYVANTLPPVAELLPTAIRHLKHYYYYVVHDFKSAWLALIALLFVGFVLVSIRDSKRNKWLTLLLSFVVLLSLLALSFGLYPALSDPIYAPRAMYGFGACICFVSLPIVTRKGSIIFKMACAVLCWCFFVFGFTYGNALYTQKEYTDYRIAAVIHDLDELGLQDEVSPRVYQIQGDIGFSPEIENMPQDYEMLRRLVPNTFGSSSDYWRSFKFYTYYGLRKVLWDDSIDLTKRDLALRKNSIYHTIYADDENVLIELKPY